ncbi:glucosyltransferase domain-containing protein [Xenorhabdus bovienii]|uniref:glucosyltransferase domain-containing protein n=1 Tax=Xenorhabdus bovienii TaxID=40576 RepID=UPI0023B35374|nr:glucosyltransferase domain-containing protein [Xenorhabdus bovienii]MDE9467074.1 glucosyltransferase domain-containing protein [Xenorhabdus bovienii]
MSLLKENTKMASIILCLYMIPIFLSGSFYRDDNGRVISQYYDWDLDGRPLANFIIKFLNFGERLTDIAPFSQILAIIIASLTCAVIATYIIKTNKLIHILSISFLFISPFFIQNLSYRFDIVTMCLAIFFAVVPFIFQETKKMIYLLIISFISVLSLLMTYQAALPLFYGLIFLDFFINRQTKNNSKKNIINLASGTIALAFYYLIIAPHFVGGGYAGDRAKAVSLGSGNFITDIISNIINLINHLSSLINLNFLIYFSIIIIGAFLFLLKIIKEEISNKKNLFLLFVFFSAYIVSILIFFSLKNPVYEPRVMIGFNALFMILAILSLNITYNRNNIRYIGLLSVILPTLYFFSIATNYSNASRSYIKYERDILQSIYNDYNNLNISGEIYLDGYSKPPYIAEQILYNNPFLRNILGGRIGSLTEYLIKSEYPLLNGKVSFNSPPNYIVCEDVIKKHNGIYTIIKQENKNMVYFQDIHCNN